MVIFNSYVSHYQRVAIESPARPWSPRARPISSCPDWNRPGSLARRARTPVAMGNGDGGHGKSTGKTWKTWTKSCKDEALDQLNHDNLRAQPSDFREYNDLTHDMREE